ncbi:MAG: hypothetical protein LBF15_02595, partial [Candidatus Peribacteria bacterium]|nr:hypothetical protein [Candidatus Peribacteria bacterium]
PNGNETNSNGVVDSQIIRTFKTNLLSGDFARYLSGFISATYYDIVAKEIPSGYDVEIVNANFSYNRSANTRFT